MNATQEAKLNMYRATQKHCSNNAAIVATVPAFQTVLNAFNVKLSTVIAATQQEDLVTKGITVDKAEAKKSLCRLTTDIAAPIFAYASSTANNKLKQEVNFSYSDLLRTKDDVMAPRCQNIKDLGTANLAALAPYGLTAAGLTTLQTTIDGYQAKVPTPRNSAAQKKTIRENLKKLFSEIDMLLKEQLDKTAVGFKAANPDFVSTYKANRVIIDPGKTKTTLKGTVLNAMDKSPVSGATIIVVETANKTSGNEKGNYEIKPIPAGIFTINVSAPKFKDKTQKEVPIKQGQITTLDFVLELA
jgi:hypothetical protein